MTSWLCSDTDHNTVFVEFAIVMFEVIVTAVGWFFVLVESVAAVADQFIVLAEADANEQFFFFFLLYVKENYKS